MQLFAAWKSCEMINLSGNRLESIPQLDGMPRLKKLYLNGNALREIPESIAACAVPCAHALTRVAHVFHICGDRVSPSVCAQLCEAGGSRGET